jgi:Na+/melibiose symporter-like transporter
MTAATRLTFTERVLFGSGAIGNGFVTTGITALLLLFYNQAVGMPPEWVGFALMVSIVLDAFWDPVIGYWTDNFKSRLGRRHPFMYAAVVPAAVAFWLLFSPPAGLDDLGRFAYLLVTIIAVRFFISVYEISSTALIPELAPDYDDRTAVLGYRFFFGLCGGFVFIYLAYQVFLPAGGGLTAAPGYSSLGLFSAAVIAVTLAASAWGVRHRVPRLRAAREERMSFADMWVESTAILRNRTFAVLLVAGLTSGLGAGLTSSLGVYFNAYFWEQPMTNMALLASSAIVAGFIGVVLAPIASRRFGKRNAVLGLSWVSLFVSIIPVSLRLLDMLPPNSSPIVFWVLLIDGLIAGVLALMAVVIIVSLLADIVEDVAARTGRHTEGLLFAFNGILQKVVAGFGTFCAGLLLAFVGFPQQAEPGAVDPEILRNLVLIWLPVTVVLSVTTLVIISFLRVDREQHEANLRRIAELDRNDEVRASDPGEGARVPSPTRNG